MHIGTFTAMVALASALVLAHALILDPIFWFVVRAATGVCFAVFYMVIESWLNERANNTSRWLVFAVCAIISLGTLGLGQLLLPIASPSDYPLFLIASILVSVAAVPVALSRAAQPKPIEYIHIRLGDLYRTSPVGMAGSFLVGAVGGSDLSPTRMDRRLVIAATAFLSIRAGIGLSVLDSGPGTKALVLTGIFGFLSFPLCMRCCSSSPFIA